jgi:RNA polymerase sigma-70 factor (ECF subfamily)
LSFDPATESDLLKRLKAGDDAAFEQLVTHCMPRMLAVARRYMRDESDAQDAVQDAFVSAFKALGNFAGDSSLATWLHTITVRACLMKLRTRKRHPEQSIDELLPTFRADGHRVNPGPRWAGDVAGDAIREETRRLVHRFIDQLPESYRTVLLLRDIEEYDTDEAASLLNISAGLVKTRLHRARQALRTLLAPHARELA